MTSANVAAMAEAFARELEKEKLDGAQIVADCETYLPDLARLGDTVFSGWASLATP